MKTLDQRILELLKKYMEKLKHKKVLKTMEEVEANTNETNLVAAPVIAELNNKLGNCSLEQKGEDFYIVGADAVRKKLGDPSIKFYETNIQLSQSGYVDINCGFRPKFFIYTLLWGGNAIAAFLVNLDKGTQKNILSYGGSGTHPTNVPSGEAAIYIIFEITDTGMRLRAPSNTHASNPAYFYVFG